MLGVYDHYANIPMLQYSDSSEELCDQESVLHFDRDSATHLLLRPLTKSRSFAFGSG